MSMIPALQRLVLPFRRIASRSAIVGVVLAVAVVLGVAFASTSPHPPRTPDRSVRAAEPPRAAAVAVDAAFDRPALDVDAFTALERRLADERRARAQALLDRLYPDRAFVTVGVELDPRWERTVEQVQPEWPAVVEEERPEAGASGSRRRVLEPFSGTREIGLLAPEIRRVSVALVLDESIAGDRTQRAAIVAAVQKAVGPVGGRDPDIEVLVDALPRPGAPSTVAGTAAARGPAAPALDVGIAGWAALVALSALLLAWRWVRRAVRPAPEPAPVPAEPDDGRGLRRDIERAIVTEPDSVARVVEGWLAETRP